MTSRSKSFHYVLREQLVAAQNFRRVQVCQYDKMHGARLSLAGRIGYGVASSWRKLAAVATATALLSCGPALPSAPTLPTDDAAFVQSRPAPRAGVEESATQPPDTLAPGDIIAVHFLGSPDMDIAQAPIDRSGRVHLPLVGDIIVAGRTLSEAEASIQTAMQRYDRSPHVTLNLVEPRGRYVSVVGSVERPGNVPLVGDPRVIDVLAAVGGVRAGIGTDPLAQLGDLDAARLVRNGAALPIDFRLALNGEPRHNVRVRAGDVIYIPPALTGRVVLLGRVTRPRAVTWHPEMRLTEALAEAEGLAIEADEDDVRVIRGGYTSPRIYSVSAKDLFAGVRKDIVLAPGDVVYVSKRWFSSVTEVLDHVVPAAAAYILYRNVSSR
jgi:polysaccharide export outer membrane protein